MSGDRLEGFTQVFFYRRVFIGNRRPKRMEVNGQNRQPQTKNGCKRQANLLQQLATPDTFSQFPHGLIAVPGIHGSAFAQDGTQEPCVIRGQEVLKGHVLLRRSVTLGAQTGDVLSGPFLHMADSIKVYQAEGSILFHQQVGSLDIPMDNPLPMEKGKPTGHLKSAEIEDYLEENGGTAGVRMASTEVTIPSSCARIPA